MAASDGVRKILAYKKESTFGVLAGATGGQQLRRVTANFNLVKEAYESAEIRPDLQKFDFRHGTRSVDGTLNGELSPESYSDFMGSVLARDFTAGVSDTGLSVTIALGVVTTHYTSYTVTRAAGSFLTAGFKIGDVVRLTGAGLATANVGNNLMIINLTALVATVIVLNRSALVAEGPIASVDVAVVGKKTFAPLTAHTDDSYTIEEFYSDILQSEVTVGNKVGSMAVSVPANGMATVDFGFTGKNIGQTGTTQYFTTPAAAPSTRVTAGANGVLLVNNIPVCIVTAFDFTVERNLSTQAVVGCDSSVAEITAGSIMVSGSFSALFEDATLRGYFLNETEITLAVALTTSSEKNSDFVSFVMPRVKLNSSSKNDGEEAVVLSTDFIALLNSAGGAGTPTEASTLVVQDSVAV